MKKITAPVVLVLLTSAAAGKASAQEPGDDAAVDFELQMNLIIVKASVNDAGAEARFILDTGAAQTVLARSFVKELGLVEAQPTVASGAGGDVEAALVGVESLSIGDYELRELTVASLDFQDINERVGGGIAGVLGFDVLSRFRLDIDYRARRVSFRPYPEDQPALTAPIGAGGDRFWSTDARIGLRRPDPSWDFDLDTPIPQIPLILRKNDGSATITLQAQVLHGVTVEQLLPAVERSLAARVDGFEKRSTSRVTAGPREWVTIEYTGSADGVESRFVYFVTKMEERLVSLNCRAEPREFESVAADCRRVAASIEVR